MTDSIPDDEFMGIFDRLCQYVSLGRVRNSGDIRKRIKRITDLQRKAYRSAERPNTIRKFKRDYEHLRTLYKHDIHKRIWNEALDNPGGIVDETLTYGYDRAQRRALRSARRPLRRRKNR